VKPGTWYIWIISWAFSAVHQWCMKKPTPWEGSIIGNHRSGGCSCHVGCCKAFVSIERCPSSQWNLYDMFSEILSQKGQGATNMSLCQMSQAAKFIVLLHLYTLDLDTIIDRTLCAWRNISHYCKQTKQSIRPQCIFKALKRIAMR